MVLDVTNLGLKFKLDAVLVWQSYEHGTRKVNRNISLLVSNFNVVHMQVHQDLLPFTGRVSMLLLTPFILLTTLCPKINLTKYF